jgi:hypothetical protein
MGEGYMYNKQVLTSELKLTDIVSFVEVVSYVFIKKWNNEKKPHD